MCMCIYRDIVIKKELLIYKSVIYIIRSVEPYAGFGSSFVHLVHLFKNKKLIVRHIVRLYSTTTEFQ